MRLNYIERSEIMNTLSHGIWVFYFTRKKKLVLPWVLGAIIPDIFYSIVLGYFLVISDIGRLDFFLKFLMVPFKGWNGSFSQMEIIQIHNTLTQLFALPQVHFLRLVSHSYVVWSGLMLLGWYLRKKWLIAFGWGWLTHIIIDMLTHVDDAIPYFYPVWNQVIRGVISYWNPKYHGTEFALVNYVAVVIMILLLFKDWWQRRKRVKE